MTTEDEDDYVASVQRISDWGEPVTVDVFAINAYVMNIDGTINVEEATAILDRLVDAGRLEQVRSLWQFGDDEPTEISCYRVRRAD